MGGDGSQKQEHTVRYAPYLEAAHQDMLTTVGGAAAAVTSPLGGYGGLDFDDLFGGGTDLTAYPSLYDMYGKFMAGLDVEVLYDQIFEDVINGTVVSEAISQEASRLSDEVEIVALPRMETGLRDINSIMSSSFIIAREQIEAERVKAIARFSAELKVKLMPIVADRWRGHLEWNKAVIESYTNVIRLYITAALDTDGHNIDVASRHALFPFNAYQYWIAAVGTLNGATNTTAEAAGISKTQKAIGGAMTGAAAGAMFGPWGAAAGGVIGLAASLF